MTEQTRKNITQVLLPGLILFGVLGVTYGPTYLQSIRNHWLAYSMQRDSLLGPVCYDVCLKSEFVSEVGENWRVFVVTDKEPAESEASNRQELLLVNEWGSVVKRDLQTDVGAIKSTHLVPEDGYAMLEVVRHVPGDKFASEVVHYQVTSQQIAMVDSETKRFQPGWPWRFGPPRHGPPSSEGGRHPWFRQWQKPGEGSGDDRAEREGQEPKSWPREPKDVAPRKEDVARIGADKSTPTVKLNSQLSKHKEDVQRSSPVGANDERLLDVGGLGGA
ncbi:hypothetical protein DTL42_09065 [Bremerella cremea]|uniref:Uncharacterized protein n=1 Tax=Bremerella cremea TaxID=1031537 RepID=A0A368KTF6_9BACT|nr:hypothetical protein [Bremerella cremea]RCS52957.1 hypothetical protein DTL42_09065 [Bremerella cremea]